MDFLEWVVEALAGCLWGEKDLRIGRVLFLIAIAILIALVGYWLYR
jgi:hypothetical protein